MASLKAGAALVDITPPFGTQIAGDIGRLRPVDEIRDPIFAHALVVEKDGRKICLLSLDMAILTAAWTNPIRQGAAERFGFDFGAVTVCGTHAHSTPSLGHCSNEYESEYIPKELNWLSGGDDDYHPLAVERSLQAIAEAVAALEPVTVGTASGIEARIAFNRRFIMRDGTARTHPPTGDAHIRYAEGPIDPEVGIVCFRNSKEQVIAALLHYTCHPNHGYPKNYISADWPGAWCDGVRELLGEQCVPLVFNGCAGNIHHNNHLDPHHINDHKRMGAILTETTAAILPLIEYHEVETLDWRDEHLQIPWRTLGPNVLPDARKLLKENPTPMWLNDERTLVSWDWMYATSLLDLEKHMEKAPAFDYEIQAFRIGDIALAALPGEPFVEGQLRIKLESPTYPTFLTDQANIFAGYIPTEKAFARGGYETNPCNGSKLAPEALDIIADKTGTMLHDLFPA